MCVLAGSRNGRVDERSDGQLTAMAATRDEGPIARVGLSNVSLEQLTARLRPVPQWFPMSAKTTVTGCPA
jgi:diketogulonate reductase-like aldo/keto reductase